jgi:outer membrane usher protein FimD/PapC
MPWPVTGLVLLHIAASLLSPVGVRAQPPGIGEPLVVAVTLNAAAMGDFIVVAGSGGDLLVSRADLEKMGLQEPASGWSFTIDGKEYLSLQGIRHLAFRLDERTATVKLAVAPKMLRGPTIDLAARGQAGGTRPTNPSAFFNYGLEYRAFETGARHGTFTGEAGVRTGDWLFLTDGRSRSTSGSDTETVRFLTRLIRDDREKMQRLTLGDFTAASEPGRGSVILGGVSFVKNFDLDPDFGWNPAFGFAGMTPLGGEIEVSLDGRPLLREKIGAGEFEIRNLWQRFAGHRLIEIALRDAFGGVTRFERGFYFSDALLRAGLQDYGYHLGFRREQYGQESFEYGGGAFLGYHRIGLSDGLTVGLAAESEEGLANLGPELAFTLGPFGQVRAQGRYSSQDGVAGYAGSAAYTYNGSRFDVMMSARSQTRDYDAVGHFFSKLSNQTAYAATASCVLPRNGTLALGFFLDRTFAGEERRTTQASLLLEVTRRLKLLTTLRNIRDGESETEVAVDLIWSPGRDNAIVRYERDGGRDAASLKAYRNTPDGEGFGYRAAARWETGRESADVDLEYNGRHGVYRLGLEGYSQEDREDGGSIELFAGGSLTAVGGSLNASRPVSDAFALVNVDSLPDVRVYRNNREIGRTDSAGSILVPRLDPFHANQIRINERDVPMEYRIPTLSTLVSPAYRQGALVAFDVRRFQAVSGYALVHAAGGIQPLEFNTGAIIVEGEEVFFPTGRGGEFYLENLAPGRYTANIPWNGTVALCAIQVPESEEVIVDLGKLICTIR